MRISLDFWTLPAFILMTALIIAALYFFAIHSATVTHAQELDFGSGGGSEGGSGDFTKFVPQGGRALIGTIPDGIKDLEINLTAQADLDIELWHGDVFVVGWEADGVRAKIYSGSQISSKYNGVDITWSGWNGVGGALGNEFIRLTGITQNDFVMKVFGYKAGTVKVVYEWEGTGGGPLASGNGRFAKLVPLKDRATIGTIPEGIQDLEINLIATADLDIELWDGQTFVVGWQANGVNALIYKSTKVSGNYNGVGITWSGWNGVDGKRGNEYIQLSGVTRNAFVMKVFAFQQGSVQVDYSWGSDAGSGSVSPTPTPTPTLEPTPTPAAPTGPVVRTWTGGYQGSWSDPSNWSPAGVPHGDDQIIIEGTNSSLAMPILNVDFTLTTGAIAIGEVNSMVKVSSGASFTNNGTVTAGGDVINEGVVVNNGVFNNEATLFAAIGSASFTNGLGGVLNNAAGGSSSGMIVNTCGGTVNDSGDLWLVANQSCIWSGAGTNSNWSNPANWTAGIVPPTDHPVLIDGESSGNATVILDVNQSPQNQRVTVEAGDTLTIGGGVALRIRQPGGSLINRGTVVISNHGSMERDGSGFVDNTSGVIRKECRGHAPILGVTGNDVVIEPCYWDAGGSTNNWTEAANWDSDSVPTPDDPVLIGDFTGTGYVVNLDTGFDLSPDGILTVAPGQTLVIQNGVTLSSGFINAMPSIVVQGTLNIDGGTLDVRASGLAVNSGTINVNGGTFSIHGDSLVNETLGVVNNNGGLIFNDSGNAFRNLGMVVNDAASTFIHDNYATLDNLGTFINHGTFSGIPRGGDVTHRGDGLWVNTGILNHAGVGDFNIWSGARLENSGHIKMLSNEFDLRGVIDNTGTLEVGGLGTFRLTGALIENRAGASLINRGVVSISSASNINNSGSVVNNATMTSAGNINNDCGGTFIGTISGSQPVDACVAST